MKLTISEMSSYAVDLFHASETSNVLKVCSFPQISVSVLSCDINVLVRCHPELSAPAAAV